MTVPQSGGVTVAIIGASGFVGRAVVAAVLSAGHRVIPLPAVRLTSGSMSVAELVAEADEFDSGEVHALAARGSAANVAINAAGLALPGARSGPELNGANALLPSVLARVGAAAGWSRLLHVSSAAVYGFGPLEEGVEPHPSSPYGWSKLLGERALETVCSSLPVHPVILRPTSVHGPGRAVTLTLTRVARSPLASVAGRGDRPSPQVRVGNVAAACVFLATCARPPSFPVVQPWEGVTTAGLLRSLGGREPRHVPMPMAKALLAIARGTGHLSPQLGAVARRLEMLWLGQSQSSGWLDAAGWRPPHGWPDWIT